MSKCSVMGLSASLSARFTTESTADAPGPPGFIISTPTRSPRAGILITARFACGPVGFASSIGTGTVVHWAVGR